MKKKVRKPKTFVMEYCNDGGGIYFDIDQAHLPTMKRTYKRLGRAIKYLEQRKR